MAATGAHESAARQGFNARVAGMARSYRREDVVAEVIDATTHL